jgi:hypothetical protein
MKLGFFQDATGARSMGRLLAFSAFATAAVIAFYGLARGIDVTAYVTSFLMFAGGLKVGQSFAEKGENDATDK